MKLNKFVIGLITIVIAALILADGVLTALGEALFDLEVLKILIGMVLVVLSAAFFSDAQE